MYSRKLNHRKGSTHLRVCKFSSEIVRQGILCESEIDTEYEINMICTLWAGVQRFCPLTSRLDFFVHCKRSPLPKQHQVE